MDEDLKTREQMLAGLAQPIYRIHWRVFKTGATGNGTRGFPKDEAQSYADALNRDHAAFLTHWVEIEQPLPEPQA